MACVRGKVRGWPLLLVPGFLCSLAVLGGSAGDKGQEATPAASPLAFRVRRQDFAQTLRADGRLRAEEVKLISVPLSEHYITEMVAEGTAVKEGDVIVRLDREGIEDEIMDVEGKIAAAEAAVSAARAAADKTAIEIEADISELEAKLALATARMEFEKGKPLPERRRAAEAKVRASEARSEYAAYWLQMTRELSTEGVTSREDVHQAEFEHYSAEIALAHTRKELTQTLQGARPEDLRSAEAALEGARLSLKEAKESREQRLKEAEADVESARNALDKHKTRLAELQEDLGKTTVCAERDGIVLGHGDRSVNIGDPVWSGRVIADLAVTSSLLLAVEVRECDSQLVEEGQPAQVHMLALPDVTISGTVAKVESALAEKEDAEDVRYLPVEVELDHLPPGLLPGMTGYADIEVRSLPNALVVPRAALAEGVATVLTPAGPQRRSVEVTAKNDVFAAVSSGLAEGDWVLLGVQE